MMGDSIVGSDLSHEEVEAVVTRLRRRHGLDVGCYDPSFLALTIQRRRAAAGDKTLEGFLKLLDEGPFEAEGFYRSLRVGYSVFFRDPLSFALLEQVLVPALVEQRKHSGNQEIRVWSAGCASGEEVWSIAITLSTLLRRPEDPSFRIFGTDLSEEALNKARAGMYSAASMGNVRLSALEDYFVRRGDNYTIAPSLREVADFSCHDLLDEHTIAPPASIFGDFDLVLCSNVLLYYRPETQRLMLHKIGRCLAPNGCLIVGETERQIVESLGGFRAVAPPAAVFRRRAGGAH